MTGTADRHLFGKIAPTAIALADTAAVAAAYGVAALTTGAPAAATWTSAAVIGLTLATWIPACISLLMGSSFRAAKMEKIATLSMRASAIHAGLLIVALYLTGLTGIPAMTLITFYAAETALLTASHIGARKILKKLRTHGRNEVRVVIVGANASAARLCREFKADPGFGYHLAGVFADNPGPEIDPTLYKGDIGDLDDFVRRENISEIYCTLDDDSIDEINTVLTVADGNMARFYTVPRIPRYLNRHFELRELGHMSILAPRPTPLSHSINRFSKRIVDIAVSAVGLVIFPIILLPVSIMIKLTSPGPVFYRQRRTGHLGLEFDCLKFRTMRTDPTDANIVTRNDPRVTAVGRFLRHTSLDELPQLINVLRGEMSIVGPRPHMISHTEQYRRLIDRYMVRHTIKPGLTGWAQVNGLRGSTDNLWKMEKRVEHDVWYIEHWSLMLDLKIIARTMINIVRGEENAF